MKPVEIRDVDAFRGYWEGFRSRTRRVVDRIPDDRFDWSPREGAWTLADLVRHLASIERWMFTENALGDGDLEARCVTPAGVEITVWKWLRAMVEHEAHHRGQIYLMLGELGVPTPPLYGLTAEQVAERSRP